jgi:hypothetical protein
MWALLAGTVPFSTEDGQLLDPEDIKERVARSQMPWTGFKTQDPLRNQVLRLVQSCCHVNPSARPSASQVVDQLWTMLHFSWLQKSVLNLQSNLDVKHRVSAMLEDAGSGKRLSNEDLEVLQSCSRQGDATAAYLLGKAIWQEQASPEDDNVQLLLLSVDDAADGK